MKISLLIATYNWPEALDRVLDSIMQQSRLPDEIIIADDGSKPETQIIIDKHSKNTAVPIIHIWHEDRGFRLARIRNKAVARAKGDYIIQIDGDVILHQDFVYDHEKAAQKNHFIVGSRVLVQPELTRKIITGGNQNIHFFTSGIKNQFNTIHNSFISVLLKSPTLETYKIKYGTRGCNMSFWKKDALLVNGYDESMVGWGFEDWDFGVRLMHNGIARQKLKFGGIQYHLFHPENKREGVNQNEIRFKETLLKHKKYTENGIKKDFHQKSNFEKVSAIIPTLNEEDNIEAAIASLNFADEIIVIDSFSTDNTISKAKALGARIIQRKFDDYSKQKNHAIEQAKYNWIFVLDADERISTTLQVEIQNVLSRKPDKDAYWIYRKNFFGNTFIKFSGWQNDKVIRLFNRKYCKYDGHLVHEEIINQGTTGYLQGKMLHYSCKDKEEFKDKITKYSLLKAQELFLSDKKPNLLQLYLKPFYRFFYHYILKLGFLDGKKGLIIACVNAYGIRKRYQELYKLYRLKKQQDERLF